MTRRKSKNPATKRGGKKAGTPLSPEQEAKRMAVECYAVTEMDGTLEGKILAYWQMGKALVECTLRDHRETYGDDLVGVFINEWTRLGGFRFGAGQAKYFRNFAEAFDEDLLVKAIDSGIAWSGFRELSADRVNPSARNALLDEVIDGWIDPQDLVAEIYSRTDIGPDASLTKVQTARRALRRVERGLRALPELLEQLDRATSAVCAERDILKRGTDEQVIEFCSGVIEADRLAGESGLPWETRVTRAKRERTKAQKRISSKRASRG
jgi:hypothetical protein